MQALPPDERTSKNLDQMMDHVVTMHNKTLAPAQKPATAGNVIPPPAIAASADGHSNLYMLSRLLTQGYIPQLSDNTWSSAKDQAFYKRFWSGMTYFIWDGGPLTNNKDSKNPLVGAWHKGLDEKVAAFTLVQVADEKQMTESALATLRTRAGNIDSKALLESELLDRKTKVDAIEEALKKQPFDLKNLQTALSNYEKSVKTPWEIIGNKLGMKW